MGTEQLREILSLNEILLAVEALSDSIIFAMEKFGIQLNKKNFVLAINPEDLNTRKLTTCFIINRIGYTALEKGEIEFVAYWRGVPMIIDFISPVKVTAGELSLITKTYSFAFPGTAYNLVADLYQGGYLFSPNYKAGKDMLNVVFKK